MNKEKFINSKMKLSKEDIIYDYYNTEEKLVKYLGIEHENYELEQKNKELIQKLKFNEKSRRKMQKSLMKKIEEQKQAIDKAYIKTTRLLDYYDHYKQLPNCIIDELINFQNDLESLVEVSE